jgi:AcrR family transcriptional regulator
MSPKVPEAYLQARRTEILEAAVRCFLEKGFQNTTMQDIYETTELSPGAVYNYFSSKEEIIIAAVKDFNDWSISSLDSLIAENPDESLIKVIRFWLAIIKQNETSKSISIQLDFYSEATRNNSIREAVVKSQAVTHIKLIELIKRNQQSGVLNPELDPLAIARAIMGMVFGIMIHKSLDPETDLDAFERVCEAIFNGSFSSLPPHETNRSGLKHQDYK